MKLPELPPSRVIQLAGTYPPVSFSPWGTGGGSPVLTFQPPSGGGGGTAGSASGNFTVFVDVSLVGSVVLTPHDSPATGVFSPASITLSAGQSGTFTYTNVTPGTYTLSVTNDRGLGNPINIVWVVAADTFQFTMDFNAAAFGAGGPGSYVGVPIGDFYNNAANNGGVVYGIVWGLGASAYGPLTGYPPSVPLAGAGYLMADATTIRMDVASGFNYNHMKFNLTSTQLLGITLYSRDGRNTGTLNFTSTAIVGWSAQQHVYMTSDGTVSGTSFGMIDHVIFSIGNNPSDYFGLDDVVMLRN